MRILPFLDPSRKEQQTGLSCPECPGTLAVSGQPPHVRFRCLIGHGFSMRDLIAAKEARLEDHLWAPVTAFRELANLLRCAIDEGIIVSSPHEYESRAQRALHHADSIQRIIDQDRPLAIEEAGEVPAAEEP